MFFIIYRCIIFVMFSIKNSLHFPTQPIMAHKNETSQNTTVEKSQNNNLPKLFIHGPLKLSSILQPHPSHNFHILNPSPSLPLHQFISTDPHHASDIAAIFCTGLYPLNADILRLLPSLRVIVTSSAGTDHIDLSECRRRGIQVAGVGDLFSDDVADMAVALLIDVFRKITAADRCLRRQLQSASWDFPLGFKVCNFYFLISFMKKIYFMNCLFHIAAIEFCP